MARSKQTVLLMLTQAIANVTTDCRVHNSRRLVDGRCFACYQRVWQARKKWVASTPGARELFQAEKERRRKETKQRARAARQARRVADLAKARAADRQRSKNPRRRAWQRARALRRYGLTMRDYKSMLVAQGRRCAICRTTTPGARRNGLLVQWHVDHDHVTNRVRGLLCTKCNTGIGLLGDNAAALERAAMYLRERGSP